nr:hypothetical protein [Tanacetum cinerariifolium]
MWKLRIEQYYQIQDYALWVVIDNGNFFNPEPQTKANANGTSTSTIPGPVTTEEKAQKKSDVKARSMLLMALPNEHLLTFSQHKDAKTLFEAIQARFNLEQIHEDDLKEMDLKCQLALLSMRARRFDWSYMADDEVSTNMALMAFLDSESNKSEFDLATCKRGLAFVKEQLIFYKKNEVMFCDQITVLKRDASFRDSKINALNLQIEKLKKEKEINQIKIDNFDNASKSLDKLIGSQISNNSRQGVGFASYNVVAPLPTGLFAPPNIDLSNSDWVSDSDEDESEEMVLKSDNVQPKHEQANQPRKDGTKTCVEKYGKGNRNFATTAVLTKSGIVPICTARQSSSRAAAPVSAARVTSAVGKQEINDVKSSAFWVWRPKIKETSPISRIIKNVIEDLLHLQAVLKKMCDKKNSVIFTEIECLILSSDFKLPDESQATTDESNLWHMRLGHINFKTINKLVKENLVRGQARKENVPDQEYILLPLLNTCSNIPSSHEEDESLPKDDVGKKSTVEPTYDKLGRHCIFDDAYDDRNKGAKADYTNLETIISMEPKKLTQALDDESWVAAMQEELL